MGGPAGTNAPKPTDKNITTKSPTTQQTKRTEQIASSTEFLHSRISSSKATPLATEKETEESPQPTHEATSAFKMSTVKSQNTSKPAISTERKSFSAVNSRYKGHHIGQSFRDGNNIFQFQGVVCRMSVQSDSNFCLELSCLFQLVVEVRVINTSYADKQKQSESCDYVIKE